jgi:hypothetical protein
VTSSKMELSITALCYYAECRYDECRVIIVMLNVIMLSVIMLYVVMLSAVAPGKLVIRPKVVAPIGEVTILRKTKHFHLDSNLKKTLKTPNLFENSATLNLSCLKCLV